MYRLHSVFLPHPNPSPWREGPFLLSFYVFWLMGEINSILKPSNLILSDSKPLPPGGGVGVGHIILNPSYFITKRYKYRGWGGACDYSTQNIIHKQSFNHEHFFKHK
jgi:hypothetical protein